MRIHRVTFGSATVPLSLSRLTIWRGAAASFAARVSLWRSGRQIARFVEIIAFAILLALLALPAPARAQTFTMSSATAVPATVQPGKTVIFTDKITANRNASNYNFAFLLSAPGGSRVAQQYFTITAKAGVPLTEVYGWTVPAGSTPGTYTMETAVFNPGWSQILASKTIALTVTAASAMTYPTLLGAPVISGTAQVGDVLTSTTGTWSGATSFAYQWSGNKTAIAGATAAKYIPVASDAGHTLTSTVTATGSPSALSSATSAATVPIVAAAAGTDPSPAGAASWYTNGHPVPQYTCVSNYYVSSGDKTPPVGNDSNSGTLSSPYATIQAAWTAHAGPGVCINVIGPNDYAGARSGSTLNLTPGGNLNSATGWAVLRSVNSSGVYQPAVDASQGVHPASSGSTGAARIYAPGPSAGYNTLIEIIASYEVVDGFEIDGVNALGNGVCLDDENSTFPGSGTIHHAIGENNLVHDCGGGGFQWNYTEYLWIYNNAVHDNSQTNGNQMSGISVFIPATAAAFNATAWDTALPFHILTIQNLLWHNYMNSSVPVDHTDGEGIIYDTWNNQVPLTPSTVNYTYPGLIYGNVACFNGGGGVQLDSTAYITVANNSTYSNYLDVANTGTLRGDGNNWGANSNDNTWINNIFQNITSGTGINNGELERPESWHKT